MKNKGKNKMKEKEKSYDVGVIVGRFQVPELHQTHKDLIKYVIDRHPKVILFLGVSLCLNTRKNPLDFESRKQMIEETFPGIIVLPIMDVIDDEAWSENLDAQIECVTNPNHNIVLYGGRESFLESYSGKYSTKELCYENTSPGSEIRINIGKQIINSSDFRWGVIWSAYNRYPVCYTTVDIAVIRKNKISKEVLLCRKKGEKLFRFIGGIC